MADRVVTAGLPPDRRVLLTRRRCPYIFELGAGSCRGPWREPDRRAAEGTDDDAEGAARADPGDRAALAVRRRGAAVTLPERARRRPGAVPALPVLVGPHD